MEVKFLDDLSTVEIPSEYDNRIAEDSANHYCVRWCGVAGDYGTLPLLSAEGADATQARAGAISKARPPERSRRRRSSVESRSGCRESSEIGRASCRERVCQSV